MPEKNGRISGITVDLEHLQGTGMTIAPCQRWGKVLWRALQMDEHSLRAFNLMVLGPSRGQCAEVTFPKREGEKF